MAIGIIKITGPIFTINSTPNTVPTNAGAGSNAGFGPPYGSATQGGATLLYIVNNAGASANITVANNGSNTGTVLMLANQVMYLEKYPFDTVVSAPNTVCTPISKAN